MNHIFIKQAAKINALLTNILVKLGNIVITKVNTEVLNVAYVI